MGIYDRDYYRQEPTGFSLPKPRSAVAVLVVINVVVYLVEMFAPDGLAGGNPIEDLLGAHVSTLVHPWMWWQFLTYGFTHSAIDTSHIVFNMLTLWFLGRDVEAWYGTKEFTRLYLVLLVFGSVVWAVVNRFDAAAVRHDAALIGASGAISGVVILYAVNFPRRILLLMFVIPVPAWLVGFLQVGYDIFGAMARAHGDNIAYTVHLAGAALAFLYYHQRWNFGQWLGRLPFRWPPARPRLKVHEAEPDEPEPDGVAEEEVDRILEKIHREGEASLTRKERRILETASREYQRRRRTDV